MSCKREREREMSCRMRSDAAENQTISNENQLWKTDTPTDSFAFSFSVSLSLILCMQTKIGCDMNGMKGIFQQFALFQTKTQKSSPFFSYSLGIASIIQKKMFNDISLSIQNRNLGHLYTFHDNNNNNNVDDLDDVSCIQYKECDVFVCRSID